VSERGLDRDPRRGDLVLPERVGDGREEADGGGRRRREERDGERRAVEPCEVSDSGRMVRA
jgi:hypothetical protein